MCRSTDVRPSRDPAVPRRRRIGHLAGLTVFCALVGLWLVQTSTRHELLDRDWVAFDAAGWRALGGDWASVYTRSAPERWPYLYPPYALPLALPLGMLPYWPSYVAAVAMGIAGVVLGCRRIAAASAASGGRDLVLVSTVLCAPVTVQVLVTGQYSWLYLLSLAGAAAAWQDGDERRAGRWLALLALKPNLALLVLPLVALRGGRAVLRHTAVTVAAAAIVTLPLTAAAWVPFLDSARAVAARQEAGEAPIEKQATLLAFLRVVSGHRDGSTVTWVAWAVAAGVVAAAVAWAWRAAGPEVPALRLLGTAALAVVAVSPRLYFYDALVLVVPAGAWYLCRDGYGSRAVRRAEGACIAGICLAGVLFFPWPAAVTAVGPLAASWAVLEAVDLAVVRRAPRRDSPPVDAERWVLAG